MERYDAMSEQMRDVISELRMLAGDEIGPSGVAWQDLAGTAALALRQLAGMLEDARRPDPSFRWRGHRLSGAVIFPSIDEEMGR